MGWEIEPRERSHRSPLYAIQNLRYQYRLAVPLYEGEIERAIGVLGDTSTRPNAVAANDTIEAAWNFITEGKRHA